jgi:hypothetical protein
MRENHACVKIFTQWAFWTPGEGRFIGIAPDSLLARTLLILENCIDSG